MYANDKFLNGREYEFNQIHSIKLRIMRCNENVRVDEVDVHPDLNFVILFIYSHIPVCRFHTLLQLVDQITT
jgi:hypothetical protein